jgi:hypothetical protein
MQPEMTVSLVCLSKLANSDQNSCSILRRENFENKNKNRERGLVAEKMHVKSRVRQLCKAGYGAET